jgi:hypothetical protein
MHSGQEIPGCATRRLGKRRMEPDPPGSRAKEPGTHRPGASTPMAPGRFLTCHPRTHLAPYRGPGQRALERGSLVKRGPPGDCPLGIAATMARHLGFGAARLDPGFSHPLAAGN